MKYLGQHIFDFNLRARSDVFLESIASGTIASGGHLGLDSNNKIVKATISSTTDLTSDVTGVLPVSNGGTGASTLASNSVLTGNGTSAIQAESTLTYDSNSLSIGGDDDSEAAIKRTTHSDDNGGNLGINAGVGTGANKTGGDLKLSAGSGTGAAPGGSIQFFSSAGGGAGSGANSLVEVGSISNIGNLQVDGTLTTGGDITVGGNDIKNSNGDTCITFDGSGNTTIAGLLTFPAPTSGADTATAVVVGPDDDGANSIKRNPHTDGNGGQFSIIAGNGESTNANGGDLDFQAGVGKGSGTPGEIKFRTGTAFGAGVADDTIQSTSTQLTISDKCEFGFGGFSLDGNTITGIDDSSEFTDDDAHIMTSAAINDRFAQINADTTGNAATATNLVASTSTAVQLGTIELGHASDTTIARSAAGKVTIEGANVQTTQICTTHHNMSLDGSSSTTDYYFPINSLADGSSSSLYYTRVVAAYDGKIVKMLFRGSEVMGSSCTIYMSKRDHDGTSVSHQTSSFQASETFDGSTKSTVIVPCGVGGTNAANWVFDEGDMLGFSLVKNTTATNVDLTVTIVYEYTV
jgi:hypothetical protein